MLQKITAMTARKQFGELLNQVHYRHDAIVITKANKPVAALVDVDLFEKIQHLKDQYNKLTTEIAKAYEDVPENIAEIEIGEAVQYARAQKRKRNKAK